MYNSNGLNSEEVKDNRRKYGSNVISGKSENNLFSLFIETLGDPIIKILLIALAVKTIFLFRDFDWFETIGIVIAILVASIISAVSEYGSNKAFEKMQEESSKINVRVRRNGNIIEIPIDEVVVFDTLILSGGDKVAADCVIVKGEVSSNESSLNGETTEIHKKFTTNIATADTSSKLYRGTTIYDGICEAVVTKVGMDTLYGKMASELTLEEDLSPLKLRLTSLAKTISKIGYIAAILIGISYLFSRIFIVNNFNINAIREIVSLNTFLSYLLEAMTLSVSVLVMSVPEGLPMMITLVLEANSKKMLKENILVRKMVGIETAGSLNVLFTDKTGTLTKGEMEVTSVISGNLDSFKSIDTAPDKYKRLVLDSIIYNNESTYDMVNERVVGGNITDMALLKYAGKEKDDNIKIISKIPFNSRNKYSITVIEKDNKKLKLIKGSYDKIIKYTDEYISIDGRRCKLDKDRLIKYIEDKTSTGLRAIAISISNREIPIDYIRGSILIGVIFIKDEVKSDAKEAVDLINKAGVNVIMVTGDSRETAMAIAKETQILKNDSDVILSSLDLSKMDDGDIKNILPDLRVIYRALPEDKKRLVAIAKELSLVTGMTGDGVNDSTALKRADVSFAMGSGTEVAKEASDIVILDNNLNSIANSILFGRTAFKNIRKFIIFQLTVNFAAVLLSLIGPFVGIPTPITVIEMLWINMVMDTLAGIAFSYETPKTEYMEEPPKKKNESILNRYMISQILVGGLYTLTLSLVFLLSDDIKSLFINSSHHKLAFFSLFIFLAVFNAFNARTHRINIFAHLKENRVFIYVILFIIFVQVLIIYSNFNIFYTSSLTFNEFIFTLFLSLTIIPFDFIRKIILKKKKKSFGV